MVKIATHFARLLFLAFAASRCNTTEVPFNHDNPFDRIYDSGKFRLVLVAEPLADTTHFHWSEVYHSEEGKLSTENLKINGTAGLLRSATAPSPAQLQAIRNAAALSGFAAVPGCSIAATDRGYANQCQAASGNHKGYFILRFDYLFTDKSGTDKTGILYSNIAVVE